MCPPVEFEPFVFVKYMLSNFVFDWFGFVVVLLSPEHLPRMRGGRRLPWPRIGMNSCLKVIV